MLRWQPNRPGPGLSPSRRRALLCIHTLLHDDEWCKQSTEKPSSLVLHSCNGSFSACSLSHHCSHRATTWQHHHSWCHSEVQAVPASTDSRAQLIRTAHGILTAITVITLPKLLGAENISTVLINKVPLTLKYCCVSPAVPWLWGYYTVLVGDCIQDLHVFMSKDIVVCANRAKILNWKSNQPTKNWISYTQGVAIVFYMR